MKFAQLLGRLQLQFRDVREDVVQNLSAAVRGPHGELWVAADERGYLERLVPQEPRVFGGHTRFHLADYLPLTPAEQESEEVDLEAMSIQGGYLWFCGSHSARRKKPKGSSARGLERLATVVSEPARFLLARIPLTEEGLVAEAPALTAGGPPRRAARLRAEGREGSGVSPLVEVLREDPHLSPFLQPPAGGPPGALALPSKDNGLDIEGLAVVGERILLGLRGPVLRGHAVLLEVRLREEGEGQLSLAPVEEGRPLRKHLLGLDGLGIRELCADGEDLLLLAGPTMATDGPLRVFRLAGGLCLEKDSVVEKDAEELERLFDIPHGELEDHAEGMALFSYFRPEDSVLVVYDAPSRERLAGPCALFADVYRLR